MNRPYYVTPKPSWIMRQFWRAAGGDRYILERSTYGDQIKYMCLGGIIVATGLMAGIAGGYAFYTIFEPRGSSLDQQFSMSVSIMSIFFGLVWGLMIFNIDRFIVTSTGKGDGTEAITWDELKGAFPRIIMGAIIALTISKPVEIRMFKSEIDVELHKEQMEKQREYLSEIDTIYSGRINGENAKIAAWQQEILEKEAYLKKLIDDFIKETSGGSGPEGYGPEAKKIEELKNTYEKELNALREKNQKLIDQSYLALNAFEEQKRNDINNGKVVANGLDGLLERIKLAHKIAGFWISLFVTLLFMAIELTPIFFKLMLIKTPYDYLEENIKELIKAEEGIHVIYNYYKDKEGQERDFVQYLNVEKSAGDQIAAKNTEKRLALYALEKYEEEMKRKIDADPSLFVKFNDDPKT